MTNLDFPMNNPPPPALPPTLPSTSNHRPAQGLAIAALALGIFSIIGGGLLLFPPILAVIFGHIALSRANKDKSLGGGGLAIGGLVTGYLGIVFFGIGLLAAMAIPAFQKVRESSLHKVMLNDARQIGAAAEQELLEHPGTPVSFTIDPETGEVSGPLSKFVPRITKGTTAVDGVVENEQDGFSLRNPRIEKGRTFYFKADGSLVR